MSNSVGTKAKKKQPALLPDIEETRALEKALLSLENACLRILEARFTDNRNDLDGLYWQRKFKNIVTPVSLALAECKGPRKFHYHYKHREDDDAVLHPVMENPLDVLAQACRHALTSAERDLVGIANERIVRMRELFERALRSFLLRKK